MGPTRLPETTDGQQQRQKMSENVRTTSKRTCVIIIMHEGTEGGATMDTPAARAAGE